MCPIFKDQEFQASSIYSHLKMGIIRCYETSVNNYHTTLRNMAQQLRFQGFLCMQWGRRNVGCPRKSGMQTLEHNNVPWPGMITMSLFKYYRVYWVGDQRLLLQFLEVRKRPDRPTLWPNQPPPERVPGTPQSRGKQPGIKMTSQLNLVPRLKMCVEPYCLPHPSWGRGT
jgi:hypothetical protein